MAACHSSSERAGPLLADTLFLSAPDLYHPSSLSMCWQLLQHGDSSSVPLRASSKEKHQSVTQLQW